MVVVKPLTVHWHQDSVPIYSACFQPHETNGAAPPPNRSRRLATAGGDNNVRIWRLRLGATLDETPGVEYLATLSKHERAVNALVFDGSGRVLASAGDDGVVCLWTLNESTGAPITAFGSEFEDVESWRLVRKCRSASFGEIYDLAWSPSGRYLAATSMDKVVSVLDATDGTCVAALRDHKHYVQGVAWDPQGQYLATQSSDQRVLVYALREDKSGKLSVDQQPLVRLDKAELPGNRQTSFHPESFSSFFRRLSFSPDGLLLLAPAAQIDPPRVEPEKDDTPTAPVQPKPETDEAVQPQGTQYCALMYTRGDLRRPAAVIPLPKQSTVVKFCPIKFKLRATSGAAAVGLPYRMVYAIATLNGVFIYDTESMGPIGMTTNLHYSSLTDLAWSPDGRTLLLTSIDGFCSVLRFDSGELGDVYTSEANNQVVDEAAVSASAPAPALSGSGSAANGQPVVHTLTVRKKPRLAAAEPAAEPAVRATTESTHEPAEKAATEPATGPAPELATAAPAASAALTPASSAAPSESSAGAA